MKKYLLLAWFLIPIDPRWFFSDRAPSAPSAISILEKMPSLMGPFEDHLQCSAVGEMLKLSRPDWIMICGYTMSDFKNPKPFAPRPSDDGE